MLNLNVDSNVKEKFLDLCQMKCDGISYQGCKVHKILEGLLLESGDLQGYKDPCSICPCLSAMGSHRYAGTVSLLLEEDCSVSSKFSITFKRMMLLDRKETVIGRVIKGLDVLSTIGNYGTRFGLTKRTMLIKSCGILK